MEVMNIKLVFKLTGGPYGDATADYDVEFHDVFTVKDFTNRIILKEKSDWGYFIFGNERFMEYNHGRFRILNHDLFYKIWTERVIEIRASGGWSRMDYYLYVENNGGQL